METFTKQQWMLLLTLGCCNFLAGAVYSLQAPFLPAEAEKKGTSTTFAGFVLGIYELTGFIACPLISGRVLRKLGAFKCFHIGILTTGTAILLFGFLNRVNNTTAFIVCALSLRVFEAAGASTTFVSSYGFLNVALPNSLATAFAVMETMFAVGMAIGPPIGEVFYELAMGSENWSFTVPFLTMGLVLFATAILTSTILLRPMRHMEESKSEQLIPNDKAKVNCNTIENACARVDEIGNKKIPGFRNFIRIPSIFVFYITVMGASMCLGFTTCTLEPHIRQFNLAPLQTGGMFLIFGSFYAGTASIWGIICDKFKKPIFVAIFGCLLIILAFTFMGPCSLIPLVPSLQLTAISLAFFGLGIAAVYVSGFLLIVNEAKRNGFSDNGATSSCASALWLSGMHLGSFTGPIFAGYLFDNYGFGVESLFLIALFTFILILLIVVLSLVPQAHEIQVCIKPTVEEKTPLLIHLHDKNLTLK